MVVVSNRLPVVLKRSPNGGWRARPGNGGLVTALTPVLRKSGGIWVGWPGVSAEGDHGVDEAIARAGSSMGIQFEPLALSSEEISGFYHGFSNEILWPLFHDLVATCNFDSAYWGVYRDVNEKAARLVAEVAAPDDFIWIQDYHFLIAARELRRLGLKNRLGFFLHTPFPASDMFLRLPWRRQILNGLLDFDLVGFQCPRDRRNFLECVTTLEAAEIEAESEAVAYLRSGRADGEAGTESIVRVGSFPISIDAKSFESLAESDAVRRSAARLARDFGPGKILLGVDRLDYTKGLPQKLRAFRRAVGLYPEMREAVTLVQHVVPSRESVPQYRNLRVEIERLVGEVNGRFGTSSWTPVRYFYHRLDREELSAFYRLADVLLVTSLKDGMNLVSKEYCASKNDGEGVLILSEFAGASAELGVRALLVNPYDADGLAHSIYRAVSMDTEERRARMKALQSIIRENDVFQWVGSFLRAADATDEEIESRFEAFVPEMTTMPSA